MKLLHVADLHIGCRLGNLSLAEDQRHMLGQILALAEDVDAVLIAGDLYHRASPGGESVRMVSDFLGALAALGKPVYISAGNHDSGELVDYCGDILTRSNIHVAGVYDGALRSFELEDTYGKVRIHLLPFVKPLHVRAALRDEMDVSGISSYADAIQTVLARTPLDPDVRNVLVAHQFVSGAAVCDSEERSVGGLDQIPVELFRDFDYVALGHLHSPQRLGGGSVCYSGSPLKYSLSEEHQRKGALRVTLGEKGVLTVETLPICPLRDVRTARGTLAELTRPENYSQDYIGALLTDPVPPLDAVGQLRILYPNLISVRMEGASVGACAELDLSEDAGDRSPLEHFVDFYTQRRGHAPDAPAMALMREIIAELEGNGDAAH